MIEVEILREPEGPFDDPFEPVPDDRTNGSGGTSGLVVHRLSESGSNV